MKDLQFIPKNLEELYMHYINGSNSLVRSILRTKLPFTQEDEREALAHDVFLRIHDHRMLERFDPKESNFGGVIYFVTRTVLSHYLHKFENDPAGKLKKSSIVSATTEEFEPGEISIESIFTEDPVMEERLWMDDQVEKLYIFAKERMGTKRPNKRDKSLLQVLEMLKNGFEVKEIGTAIGVTGSTVTNYINYIKQEMDIRREENGELDEDLLQQKREEPKKEKQPKRLFLGGGV